MITVLGNNSHRGYTISSSLLILPEEIRDKIFKLIPILGQIAIITNDKLISQIMLPFNQEKLPVYNTSVETIYKPICIVNILYGNALSKEDVLIKKLEPLCFLRSSFCLALLLTATGAE